MAQPLPSRLEGGGREQGGRVATASLTCQHCLLVTTIFSPSSVITSANGSLVTSREEALDSLDNPSAFRANG